jgi:hypothetical protein
MTATASHDSVDPAASRQARRTDELEHWLTDLRVNLSEDTADWLRAVGDSDDPASSVGPSTVSPPTEDHSGPDSGAVASSTDPNGSLKDDPPGPAVGRHRAAD